MQRRLAAILAADMVGYSRLIERDEAGTIERLKADRQALIDPTIEAHGGHIVRLAGDGALVEFPSVVEAVQCALDIQRGMSERNEGRAEDRHIVFRIGVNLGDIVVEDDNLHGEGINVAARLESLCEPGAILLSEEAARYVEGKIDAGLEFIEEHTVKNIDRPVRIWRAEVDKTTSNPVSTPTRRGIRWGPAVAAVLSLVVVLGALLWFRPWARDMEPEHMVVARTDKPSIAVLPFTNMSDDPAQEYFSDGISEDLITDLAKISGIMVIARNSSFIYRGTSNDVLSVAKNLGVRYVLEGSVRKAADRVRINAQLIDSQTGGHIWTDRYDGDLSDVFTVQDDITARIVSALELRLTEGEEAQIAAAETRSHEAYDAVLRGFEHFRKYSPDDFAVAESLFEQAIAIDPGYSRAYAALAAIYWEAWKRDWHISTGFWGLGWEKANGYLKRALENPTPLAHQISAQMLTVNRRYEEAILAARRATALAPNDALGYVALADALIYAGEPASAIPLISEAMELDPHVPAASLTVLGRAQYSLGMYEAAANTLEDAHSRNPNNQDPLVILAATYGQLAQEQEAAWTISMIDSLRKERRRGKLSIDSLRNQMPFKEVTDRDRLLEGLRRAGVPDW